MTPVHIIGHPGSGKTTLVSDITEALVERKIRVGTLKHSAHAHELDKPGKDSHKHRIAGANPVAMVTASMAAVYLSRKDETDPEQIIERYYRNTDVVLIEGWISGPYPKMEVWRTQKKRDPLFQIIDSVVALICNDVLDDPNQIKVQEKRIQLLKRSDLNRIVDFIMTLTSKE